MILTIPELKGRFATTDKPSAKDFSDFIDSLIAYSQGGLVAAVNSAVSAALAAQAGGSGVIVQATPPNASQAANIWLQMDAGTQAILRAYRFSTLDNCWHARHPLMPGQTILMTDPAFDVSQIATYDGGGTPGSGAMWQVVLAGTFPLATGPTTASNYPYAGTGGEATHALTTAESPFPDHKHIFGRAGTGTSAYLAIAPGSDTDPALVGQLQGYAGGYYTSTLDGNAGNYLETGNPKSVGSATAAAHNNMPPYTSVYYLQRTTRLDYVVAPGA